MSSDYYDINETLKDIVAELRSANRISLLLNDKIQWLMDKIAEEEKTYGYH